MGEEKGTSFTISDRRPFNPDGSLRLTADSGGAPQEAPDVVAAPPAQPASAPTHDLSQTPTAAADESSPGSVGFSDFVLSLAGNAMMCLGLVDGGYGPMEPDLPSAQHLIDVLDMLQHKTRNNLTPEESKTLDEVLHNLRLQYVRLTGKI